MKKRIVRFEIQDLLPIGLTLVVAGIGIVYGMNVMGDVRSDFCGTGTREHYLNGECFTCPNTSHSNWVPGVTICSNVTPSLHENSSNVSAVAGGRPEFNASSSAIKGVAKIPEKMPLIATVIVAAIVIGILVRYLMVRFT